MNPIPINIAVEDELTEAVALRLLQFSARPYAIGTIYGRSGFGYLKNTIKGWNDAAKGCPMLIVTDMDRRTCPSELITEWLPQGRHHNLILRVAVREVDAWLLADRKGFASFLEISEKLLPEDVEALPDPKHTLVTLAARSRNRSIREDIAPRKGGTAKQGPGYNAKLRQFVRDRWNIGAAKSCAPSLERMIRHLAQFQPVW